MINTFCNNVVSVFTHCSSVTKIYVNCEEVWTARQIPDYWYIQWWPSNIRGTFIGDGSNYYTSSVYRLEDYSGYYSGFKAQPGNVAAIMNRAFISNSNITSIETNVDEIGASAFMTCSNLSIALMSRCSYLNNGVFYNCSRLKYVSLPECTNLWQGYAFGGTALSQIELPKCSLLGEQTFIRCSALKYVSIPKCLNISRYCFAQCSSLERIELPVCRSISHGAFQDCYNLSEVILGLSSVVWLERYSMSGDTTFRNTLIASGIGGIYVPSSLVSDYKSNSLWSSLSSVIFPIQ